jgi:hypothetical protein
MVEKVLSLDISTKAGWALFRSTPTDFLLLDYGKIPQIHTPDGEYPPSFIKWAYDVFHKIEQLIKDTSPDVVVIEETSAGSKAIYTQKILEWIHFLVAEFIVDNGIKVRYIMTEEWRRDTGCYMSKEESKRNKEVKKYKQKNATKIAYGQDGKRIGKITRKHVNIRRANEVFETYLKEPLRKKDEDTADSLLLGYSYHLRRFRSSEKVQG